MSLIIGLNSGSLGSVGTAPVGATLMKTGQTTSYRTGDDGDLEAGRATDFTTLAVNNPFGNTNRFTDELGGSTYTNNIVIDWSTYDVVAGTVLGYYRTVGANLTWDLAIDAAAATSVGTFTTGWRLTNQRELSNIMSFATGLTAALNYAPFNITLFLWTSSTRPNLTTHAAGLSNSQWQMPVFQKTTGLNYIACRTFTVTGTVLS